MVIRALLFSIISAVAFFSFAGCNSEITTGDSGKPSESPAKDTSVLLVTNQRESNSGPITIMLWNVNAADAITTPPAKTLKTVDFGKTLKMGIPKGIWKMGYSINGERTAMPDTVEAGVNWPKLEIDTGKTYSLIIKTDEGNLTKWAYNLPLVK